MADCGDAMVTAEDHFTGSVAAAEDIITIINENIDV